MKNYSLPCLLMALVFFSFSFKSNGQANNTNGDNIDVKFVRFNMMVDPTLASTNVMVLNGAVTTYFTTKVANVQKINFDFYRDNTTTPLRLIGDSIRYHGVKYNLTAAKHSNDTLIVDLPAAIATIGTLDSVTVYYHGNPPQSSGSRGYKKNTTSSTDIISTHSSGFFARQWWPCKHNMTDKIDSVEFLITAPSAYKAVANGLLLNGPTPPTVGANKTWHWKSRYPVAHYLIAFAVHQYVIHNSPPAIVSGTSVPIINYLTTGVNTATVRNAVDAMGPVIEHFSTLFGDYPFKNEKYGHVVYTFGGGMENQTASYIGTGSISDRSILAHELAHQWFGDKVTTSKWNHNWVNEGFARYAEILYSEQFESATAAVTKRASYKSPTSTRSATETIYRYDVEVVNDATDHTGKIFVSSMVYNKASIIVSMLRKLVGDVKFFQALKNYLNDPLISYGYATTEDVQRHFEAVSGKNLTAFFDDFIYKSGYPTYNVQWDYSPLNNKVAIKLNQTKTSSGTHALSGRFHTVLPIRLRKTTAPARDTVIVVYDDGVASLSPMGFKVSFAVDAIEVDPYSESYSYFNTITAAPGLAITLPSNLLSFDAYKKEEEVNVVWNSSNETGFSHYEVEHSADGLAFSKIGSVNAKNQAVNHYEFIHAYPASGHNYYRLKMTDIDGQYKYSMVLTVVMDFGNKVKVAPNPAHDIVRITLPYAANNNLALKLINLQGQVYEVTGTKANGNIIEMNVKNIPSGNYWLEFRANGNKIVERILVQH